MSPLWSTWHLDWCCVTPVLVAGGVYALGLVRLWRSAGIARGTNINEVSAFLAGWLAIAVSVLSPLHALGTQMFTAHMVEHEILMVVAAPLLVIARPLPVFVWAFGPQTRKSFAAITHSRSTRRFWSWFTAPVTATILHAVALWGWHIPVLFDAALTSEPIHALQHICFLGTALVFWWSVLSRHAQSNPGAALAALFITMIHTSLLGALFTFSHSAWYASSGDPFAICGLTRIEDQQVAGLVMWIPAGLSYLTAALWLMTGFLKNHRVVHEAAL